MSRRPAAAAATARCGAGVESAAQDARILLSFVSGVELVRLPLLAELDDDHVAPVPRAWSTGGPSGFRCST